MTLQATKDRKRIQATLVAWRNDPVRFAKEALGIELIYKHQAEYLDLFGKMTNAKHKERILKLPLNAEERKYADRLGICIMSGRGSGKDASTAWAHIWFATMFSPHLVLATGPNRDHLRRVYWGEVEKWLKRKDRLTGESIFPFADDFKITATSIEREGNPKEPRLSIYRTVAKEADESTQAEGVSGFHQTYVLYVLDEASATPMAVFNTMRASATRKDDVRIMTILFNPNRNHGFAYDIHFDPNQTEFFPLHWDLTVLECGDPKVIEDARNLYGEDSNYFRVNFKGLPPLSDASAVIPYEFIEPATWRVCDTKDYDTVLSVDPAGEGRDRTAYCIRTGPAVTHVGTIHDSYSDHIAEKVIDLVTQHKVSRVYVDKNGLGLGVYSILRSLLGAGKVFGVNVAEKSRKPERFHRLRDELWWRLREQFEEGRISIPPEPKSIRGELASAKIDEGKMGAIIHVSPKSKMFKILGHSPDYADAIMMTCYHDYDKMESRGIAAAMQPRPWDKDKERRPIWNAKPDPLAWLRR